jgi:glycosyltransferase involved in cell wall biosynthesis
MKVIFDARYIRTDFHDGISRYSTELARSLAMLLPVVFLIHDERQRAFLPDGAEYLMLHPPTSWKEPLSALYLNQHHPDVVVSPMQTIGSFGRRFKLILTLHDLIYYRHRTPPRNLPWPIRLLWRLYHLSYWPQRLTLNSADLIATVSQTSQRDIRDVKLTKRPIVVIPNAPQQLAHLIKTPATTTKQPKNLIYMGSFMPYKNVETLIRGMAELPEYTLHLLSKITPERQAELENLIPTGANVIFHNGVSDTKYAELLADQALLVTASLDEGYGLPIAESLAMGVPAVVSDLTIFHEVGGEGALYFPPLDSSAFAACVKQASTPETYAKLSQKGLAYSQTFSWDASARALVQAIESLHIGK